ncbi:universal stress protein [Litchfieldia salsa]|uniref:Nucleotide-binding universal stress protein, UspA family n=1 Tax=Litchfieldia salsa TaxID=930152 RepID=A0A1H0WTL2_9BACI|nr:universal stress protein [Litchfieldia salsa]SDP93972.1 Nucleotide-binding universal stress protein, UspA family [Litchfieldia salsa]
MFNNILVPVDGSLHSLRAAEKAIELARIDNHSSFINLLYVVDGSTSKYDVLRNWDLLEVTNKRLAKFQDIVDKANEAGIEYELKILRGDPVSQILKHAKLVKSDVIVLGSRGLNSLQEMVLGSVSHKIAKKAKCPVMIIK